MPSVLARSLLLWSATVISQAFWAWCSEVLLIVIKEWSYLLIQIFLSVQG